MSHQTQSRLLVLLGVVATVATISIQIIGIGEIKGKLETVVDAHEKRLDAAEGKLNEQMKDISEIKGKLHGIASQVGKVPSRVIEKINAIQ